MEENKKKLATTLEMFKPFLEGNNLSTEMSDYLQTVYYVPREKMSLDKGSIYNSNLFDGTKIFPKSSGNTSGYFVAEFWFPYLIGDIKKSNYYMISHVFKLDITQIEIELKNFSDVDSRILNLENIAYVIQTLYKKFIPYLSGENGVVDYKEITKLLYDNFLNVTIAREFGQ